MAFSTRHDEQSISPFTTRQELSMAVWAYECRPCGGGGETADGLWLVSRQQVDAWPAEVTVLRVKSGAGWLCAAVDRSRPVQAEAMLLRDAVASDPGDCPDCGPPPAPAAHTTSAEPLTDTPAPPAPASKTPSLTAAAISLQGRRFLVVLAPLAVVQSAGEADMLIADLQPRFAGVPLVLMGQHDDGTPQYHGDYSLVDLLADLPIDRMPWKPWP
jgi:hypothetical protein